MADNDLRVVDENQFKELQSRCKMIFEADPTQYQTDASLRRFLRAFLTADDSFKMLLKSNKWRREFGVENLTEEDKDIKEEIATGKACLLRHRDFSGRPILYISAKRHNAYERDIDRVTKFIVYMLEQACKKCDEDIIDNLCIVFDLKEFSTANMDYQFVKNLIWLLSHHYPERLGTCLIINAPMIFYGCWTVIKPWLSNATSNKVTFADDKKICEYLHPDMLPADCTIE
jgi:hypothetical protein